VKKFSKEALPSRNPEDHLGGEKQQDASEFLQLVFLFIDNETNLLRDQSKGEINYDKILNRDPIRSSLNAWQAFSSRNNSIIAKYFTIMEMTLSECEKCGHEAHTPAPHYMLNVPIALGEHQIGDLDHLLKDRARREFLADARCENCNHLGRFRVDKFARLPDRLVIVLNRFKYVNDKSQKISNEIRFRFRDLDLTEYMINGDPNNKVSKDPRFGGHGRMLYDCYGVSLHQGGSLTSGHYYSYVQDDASGDPTDWWQVNDSFTERVKIGTKDKRDHTRNVYKENTNAVAFILYYKRKGT